MEAKITDITAQQIKWILDTDEETFQKIAGKFFNGKITERQYYKEMAETYDELKNKWKSFGFVRRKAKERDLKFD